MKSPLPTSRLARASVAGGAAMAAGREQVKYLAKRPFLSQQAIEQSQRDRDEAIAENLFHRLAMLRGTALKIAQMLSMEADILSPALRKELSKSYHQVPPLGRALVRKLVLQEFGAPPEAIFRDFDHTAFAAASLGQVHAACTEYDAPLAVKLQYPGIDVTIDNDLKLARGLIRPTRYAATLLPVLDEIENRLKEETDYRIEAENTRWFRQNLRMASVVVPDVIDPLSSRRILTTERLDGLHLDDWLATNPSQQARNRAAQQIYDVFTHSLYQLQRLHADPNPGNYLFMANDQLGLIDFGCVTTLSTGFIETLPPLLHAYIDQDAKTVFAYYRKLGMRGNFSVTEAESFYQSVLKPFGEWVAEPFRHDRFDFSRLAPAAGSVRYSVGGTQALQTLLSHKAFAGLSREFVFFDRTYFGLYQIFERMGATVRMRHQWLDP